MPSASVAFTHLGEIDGRFTPGPWIGSDRNFHAKRTFADPDAVDGIGMQVVRNEFVVALQFEVGNVEENRAVAFFSALAQNVDGPAVPFEQGRQYGSDDRLLQNRS